MVTVHEKERFNIFYVGIFLDHVNVINNCDLLDSFHNGSC